MVMGSWAARWRMKYMPAGSSNFAMMLLVVVLSAIVVGMLYASLLAVACINFKADQTLVGTA
jgi:simple sugar transport system permease protein